LNPSACLWMRNALPPNAVAARQVHYLYYQVITFGSVDLILLTLALRDRRRAEGGWVFSAMLTVFVAAHVLWFTVAQSERWRVFAGWFRDLPLT
jgi:hypothetical protein